MAVQIQLRNDTAENWANANPILAQGEIGIENDTKLIKVGDGIENWNDLPYGLLERATEIDGGSA
jgi:hypothetical protein